MKCRPVPLPRGSREVSTLRLGSEGPSKEAKGPGSSKSRGEGTSETNSKEEAGESGAGGAGTGTVHVDGGSRAASPLAWHLPCNRPVGLSQGGAGNSLDAAASVPSGTSAAAVVLVFWDRYMSVEVRMDLLVYHDVIDVA